MMPFGKWEAMWEHRGPWVPCTPWAFIEKRAEEAEREERSAQAAALPETVTYEVREIRGGKDRGVAGNVHQLPSPKFAVESAAKFNRDEAELSRMERRPVRSRFVAVEAKTTRSVIT